MPDNNFEVSIVIPFHRIPEDIEAISRWVAMIPEEYEVILVHDVKDKPLGPELLKQIRLKHPHLVLIEGFYKGPGGARNAGLAIVKGKYLAFWDSDDFPILENFQLMVEYAQSEKLECVVGGYIRVNEQERLVLPSASRLLEQIGIEPGLWRILFLSSAVKEIRFPEIYLGEDQIFLNFVDRNIRAYSAFRFPVYKYRCNNPSQLTSKKCDPKDLIEILGQLLNDAQRNGKPSSKLFNYMIIRVSLTFLKNSKYLSFTQLIRVLSILKTAKTLSGMTLFEIIGYISLFARIRLVR